MQMVLSKVELAAHEFHVSLRAVLQEAVVGRNVSRCPEARVSTVVDVLHVFICVVPFV